MVGFNPLPHAEGDPLNFAIRMPTRCFNPLPHAEGDQAGPGSVPLPDCRFNPLPHAEGDRIRSPLKVWGMMFQSTPSRRGRLYSHSGRQERKSFNPLPHAEGDSDDPDAYAEVNLFQSTPSRRGRRCPAGGLYRMCRVSIHSLTQRETQSSTSVLHHHGTFQSTPSRRGRLCLLLHRQHGIMFQSTPSRRGRHRPSQKRTEQSCFNPLPHAEGDILSALLSLLPPTFQSTPSRRGRHQTRRFHQCTGMFQSTPSRRGRRN